MPQPRNPDHPTRRPAELRQGTCKIAAETKGGSWAAVPCREERTCIVRHNGWGSNIQNANSLRKTPPPKDPHSHLFRALLIGYHWDIGCHCLGRADSMVRRGNIRGYTRSPQTDRGARC